MVGGTTFLLQDRAISENPSKIIHVHLFIDLSVRNLLVQNFTVCIQPPRFLPLLYSACDISELKQNIAMKATFLFLSGVGFQEILLIGLFVLVFFGAKKIPEFMKGLGKGVREFKDSVKDVKKEVEDASNAAKIDEGK